MEEKKDHRPLIRLTALVVSLALYFILLNLALNYLILYIKNLNLVLTDSQAAEQAMAFKAVYLYTAPVGFDNYIPVLGAAILAFLTVIKLDQQYEIKHGNKTTKGGSRFMTTKEMEKVLYSFPKSHMEKAKHSGIILALENGKYYIDPSTIHSLIIGTTRSGKGQTFVLPMVRHIALSQEKHSMVLNDPKGELLEFTYDILKDNGYEIVVLNLRDTEMSSLFNPLQIIIDEYVECRRNNKDLSKCIKLIASLSDTFTHNEHSDPIWPDSARSLMNAMILYLLERGYDTGNMDKVSMYSVYQMFIDFGTKNEQRGKIEVNALDELFKDLAEREPTSPAVAAYSVSNFAKGEMRSSIFSTLASNINIFGSDTGISKLTSGNQIDFRNLVDPKHPMAIFIVVPDNDSTRHVIASLFVNQCYNYLVEYSSNFKGQKLPQRVHFILDEFGNMPRIPDMDTKITVGAGRNLLFNMFIQDLNQLETKYGNAGKTIRSNSGNLVYINSLDKDTNQYFSDILGIRTNEYRTYSGSFKEGITSQSLNVDGTQLLHPDELSILPFGTAVTKRQRCYPIKSVLEPFYELGIEGRSVIEIAKSMTLIDKPLSETIFPRTILWEPLLQPVLDENGKPKIINDEKQIPHKIYHWKEIKAALEKEQQKTEVNPLRQKVDLAKAETDEEQPQTEIPKDGIYTFPDIYDTTEQPVVDESNEQDSLIAKFDKITHGEFSHLLDRKDRMHIERIINQHLAKRNITETEKNQLLDIINDVG